MPEERIIINIGRQLGSGGRTIGKMLAQELDCKFYDKEILYLAAKESGFSESFFAQHDENKHFFKTLFHLHAQHVSDNNFYPNKFSQESLFQFQADAILKASKEGKCVFVGRCADYILRDNPYAVNIFITADLDFRIAQVSKRHNCSRDEALKIIHDKEDKRANYYNYYTGKKWGNASSYDLCVNVCALGMEETKNMLVKFIREKAAKNNRK